MKKTILTTAVLAALGTSVIAQNNLGVGKPTLKGQTVETTFKKHSTRCASQVPDKKWDDWFNQAAEQLRQQNPNGVTSATYTIPVVFHIIKSSSEAVGSGHNVSQTQVNSQIPILNADYGGTGYNTSQYSTMTYSGQPAFKQYATANSLPAPDNNGVVIANSGITFCLATKNPSGTTLTEPGIDRVSWQSISGASDPATQNQSGLQTLFDTKIKPATIWDPTKYFNVWVSDGGTSGLLGYATFPPSSGLTGLSGVGTSTTDGVWMSYQALGNTGTASAPYNKGRTLTHESGHWLGLRHIWGDGTCATDYCNDTPPAAAANFVAWPTSYPYNSGTCSSPSNSPCGEMFMNFMDYSDDAAMWMFTTDQVTRFHTALANSPMRSGLTASAANLCNVTVSTPTAAFTPPSSICAGAATGFTDASSGPPTAWNWSVSPATGVTITTNTIANPTINFTNPGTYTVTDAVSNSAGSNSVSHTVTVTSCTTSACDTLSNITSSDTCVIYTVSNGYLSGSSTITTTTTTTYKNQAIGELYLKASFPTNITQVKGAMILFYRESASIGTNGTSVLTLGMCNNSGGVPGTTVAGTQTLSLSNVVTTTPVSVVNYAGSTSVTMGPYMLPYKVLFSSPLALSADFFLTLTMPTNSDTAVVYSGMGGHNASNTAAIKLKPSTSTTATWYNVGTAFGQNFSFAIIPIACPATTSIADNELGSNIVLYPNPSNGNFNFAVTMPEATSLSFNVVNTLGQSVFSKTEHNVSSSVLTYDLSSLGKGVYFVNIVDGKNNKTVKKIIIE
ncbi:MAG: M43 family zinc metalloprotease [Bacteroidia bacterium]